MLAMMAAMQEESAGLKRRMAIRDTVSENGCRIFLGRQNGKDALLAETGIGRESAERATRLILERYAVTGLISFGFAGALNPELRVGDIVLCATLRCGDGQSGPCHSDAALLSRPVPFQDGKIARWGQSVTVAQPASRPEARQALARASGADIVDMEGYWIARIASERQVPFLAVRAVSDTVRDRLVPLEDMLGSDGRPCRGKAIRYLVSHPDQLMILAGLYRSSRKARTSLTNFLVRLMERM
jgi:adenosylhomocysteine nucleosidase